MVQSSEQWLPVRCTWKYHRIFTEALGLKWTFLPDIQFATPTSILCSVLGNITGKVWAIPWF